MDKKKIIETALKNLSQEVPITYKIQYTNDENVVPSADGITNDVGTINFYQKIPHDSPTVFNIPPKRAFELKHRIEQLFYDCKLNGNKVRKNIYQVDTAWIMQYIVQISESTEELFFLTFECGVLCAPLYPEYDK